MAVTRSASTVHAWSVLVRSITRRSVRIWHSATYAMALYVSNLSDAAATNAVDGSSPVESQITHGVVPSRTAYTSHSSSITRGSDPVMATGCITWREEFIAWV